MTTKVAILIDGGFLEPVFCKAKKKNLDTKDVMTVVNDVMAKVIAKTAGATNDILFRIYYYDCKPFGEKRPDSSGKKIIDFSQSTTYKSRTSFLEQLAALDQVALRLGEISFSGWKQDMHSKKWRPDFKQKGVDMKFGLDIAWMAMKHIVDKIVLVAGDSDFIAPVKFARKEGLQVYLYPMGNHIKSELHRNCDYVLI